MSEYSDEDLRQMFRSLDVEDKDDTERRAKGLRLFRAELNRRTAATMRKPMSSTVLSKPSQTKKAG